MNRYWESSKSRLKTIALHIREVLSSIQDLTIPIISREIFNHFYSRLVRGKSHTLLFESLVFVCKLAILPFQYLLVNEEYWGGRTLRSYIYN